MQDAFFLSENKSKRKKIAKKKEYESSDSDDIDNLELQASSEVDSEEDHETAAQKRLRLAKAYLDKVSEDVQDIKEGEIDAKEIDRELIAARLRNDALEAQGKVFRQLASENQNVLKMDYLKCGKSGPRSSLTAVCFSNANPPLIYATSKDAMMVKWDFLSRQRLHVFQGGLKPTKKLLKKVDKEAIQHDGHNQSILCLAATSDGKYIATGGCDKVIYIWSTTDNALIGELKQHRDAISGLAFKHGQHILYSASFDRTVKLWNGPELSYIETLFGHQDLITDIDTLSRDRCVTVGSRDRTARLWKIPEESQLVFRGGGGTAVGEDLVVLQELKKDTPKKQSSNAGSIDAVAMIDEDYFLTGDDAGSISFWNTLRKKPIYTRLNAHASENGEKTWITSIACLAYTDLFASGSWNGQVRLWKISETKKSFSPLADIPIIGFINDMQFFETFSTQQDTSQGIVKGIANRIKQDYERQKALSNRQKHIYLAIAVGQEHRLGRWHRIKEAKNQVIIAELGKQ